MKILQIHNDYLLPGGETRSVEKIGSLLTGHGHSVSRYWKTNDDLREPNLADKIRFVPNLVFNHQVLKEIQRLAASADIVHVHNLFPKISLAAYYGARRAGKPIIQHLQNYRLFCANGVMNNNGIICDACKNGKYGSAIFSRCHKDSATLGAVYASQFLLHRWLRSIDKVDRFIAISNAVKDIFVDYGLPEQKIDVLHHFLDDGSYSPAQADDGHYVFLGRLSREKGVRTMIDAFLRKPDLRLTIIGDGPEKAFLEEACRGQGDRILFTGQLAQADYQSLLGQARALIMPSETYETFGLAAIEAMAAGIPVIAARIGGLTDIVVENENGFMFSSGSSDELVSCLDKVEGMSPEARQALRVGASHDARLRFGSEIYYTKLMDIYRQLAS